jgi:hypothetical protein
VPPGMPVSGPQAEAMVLGAAGDPPIKRCLRARRGVRQRTATAPEPPVGVAIVLAGRPCFFSQPLDRQTDDLARRFAGHHQPGLQPSSMALATCTMPFRRRGRRWTRRRSGIPLRPARRQRAGGRRSRFRGTALQISIPIR